MSPHVPRERRRRRKTSQEERICSICSQSFKKAEHLARHFRSHTKERPFTCEVCGKFYARQDTLLRHSRSHHVNAQPSAQVEHRGALADSVFMSTTHTNRDYQTSQPPMNIPRAEHFIPIPEPLAPVLQCTPSQDNPGLATISSFGPSPEDIPVETGQSSHDHDDIFAAHLLSSGMGSNGRSRGSPWAVPRDGQWDSDWTSWLTGADFDLDAVNQSLIESTEVFTRECAVEPPGDPLIPDLPPKSGGGCAVIQRKWHTFVGSTVSSGRTTPDRMITDTNAIITPTINNNSTSAVCPTNQNNGGMSCHIRPYADESYRQKLADSLRQRVQPGILPSTTFLDFCVQAYFSHFHSIFPLIHPPTFYPSKKNAVLLLSICSIGSLFLGSPRAIMHGISMFERLNKAILASWDVNLSSVGDMSIIALQASLIGQTFGLLMGRPRDLTGIEIFHGSIIAWARRIKVFDVVNEPRIDVSNLENGGKALEAAWRAWIRIEEKKRIILGIHIHDVELAKLHHHEPILRHSIEKLPQLAEPDLFAALNATAWKRLMMSQTTTQVPPSPPESASPAHPPSLDASPRHEFLSYTMLESIGALTHENRDSPMNWPSTVQNCESLLMQWYSRHFAFTSTSNNAMIAGNQGKHDPFCLMILWHSTFMHLYTRFDDLECASGREGETTSQRYCAHAKSWAQSSDAKRTLLHAALIQRHFQSLATGAEPAIHVPMALYHCGIAWASFTRFGVADVIAASGPGDSSSEVLDFPELRMLGINQPRLFHEITRGLQWGRAESGPFFRIIDLLGKVSHWKVSQSFTTTLLAFVENSQDLF